MSPELANRVQGRGKLDRHHQRALPVKDVYLYLSLIHISEPTRPY